MCEGDICILFVPNIDHAAVKDSNDTLYDSRWEKRGWGWGVGGDAAASCAWQKDRANVIHSKMRLNSSYQDHYERISKISKQVIDV